MTEKILIVDDEKKICNILTQILKDEGYSVKAVNSGEESLKVFESFDPDVILMDQNMPGIDGIETTGAIQEKRPGQMVIILTAYGSIPQAVGAIKKGAYDYIAKPFDNEELLLVINRALKHNRLSREISQLRKQLHDKYSFDNIIGHSIPMQRIFEQMRHVCDTDATVLVQGESGTGKELVVRAIHYNSRRKDGPLVTVNCGAIPVNLIESEFFGHEKGAFTDAKERQIGKFEDADGGTIFLDEVAELPIDAQVKLLRALEEKKIVRLGGRETIPVNIRIIAATNKDLNEALKDGSFRTDLYYRLNIFTIAVPLLRERKEDIPGLIEHFIKKYNEKLGLTVTVISGNSMKLFENHDWPGNVRDLENAVQSAMILAKNGVVCEEHLPMRIRGFPVSDNDRSLEELGLELYMKQLNSKMEKEIIRKILFENGNSRTKTAEKLKMSRKTLFNKMKTYGI